MLVLTQSFYVLKPVLALRLDALFQEEDHRSKVEIDELRQDFKRKLERQENLISQAERNWQIEKEALLKQIDKLHSQIDNIRDERQYLKEDLE